MCWHEVTCSHAYRRCPCAGIIDPELVYLAAGYGGVVSGDEDELYSGMWQAYRNVQVGSPVSVCSSPTSISVPHLH